MRCGITDRATSGASSLASHARRSVSSSLSLGADVWLPLAASFTFHLLALRYYCRGTVSGGNKNVKRANGGADGNRVIPCDGGEVVPRFSRDE